MSYMFSFVLPALIFFFKFHSEKNVSLNASFILGGTHVSESEKNMNGYASGQSNVVPKIALAKGDLRFLTKAQKIEKNSEHPR